jgi:hypothetical protein
LLLKFIDQIIILMIDGFFKLDPRFLYRFHANTPRSIYI